MPIQQDLFSYHKFIDQELKLSEKRVRDLIGSSHWLKANILRKVISDFAPKIYKIGTGYVCYPGVVERNHYNSDQLDILITSKLNPILYTSAEIDFVKPDSVNAIIDVKHRIMNKGSLYTILSNLSRNIKSIRSNSENSPGCWAGLYIHDIGHITDRNVLEVLQNVTNGDPMSAINCVAIGDNKFVRFWENGHSEYNLGQDPVWHSYDLYKLSHAYFISDLISHLSPTSDDVSAEAWFPVRGFGVINRFLYAKLTDSETIEFPQDKEFKVC